RPACGASPSHRSLHGPQHTGYGFAQLGPAPVFVLQLLAAGFGQLLIARAAIVFCDAPLPTHPAVLLHAVECTIKGALFGSEDVVRGALDVRGHAVGVSPPAL